MDTQLEPSWKKVLKDEFEKDYFLNLSTDIHATYLSSLVYPPPQYLFTAFSLCPFDKVKVVILGQDPYHGPGQAHGLSFSVPKGIKIPPSLRNIYKEVESDIGTLPPDSGNLERWASQGVLLLNATLTVEAGKPGSHQKRGWEDFTDAVIEKISQEKEHVVFMLWGNFARSKKILIDDSKHLVLEATHPSPFSAHSGFFGCKHFSKANAYLKHHNLESIDW